MVEALLARPVYVAVMVLLAVGLYGMLAKRNLAKKLIGMVIFQSAVFLFFIQGAAKREGSVPIIDPELGPDADRYVNPLPHLLILTALVVGVGVFGLALALLLRIHRRHRTFDEDVIIANLSAEPIGGHAGHAHGHGEAETGPTEPGADAGEEPPP
jgi:multicomponent Na+:H+ antiporter subunit C